ncbi:MAG TPA: hypothetical protein EYO58_00510 [Flavobacteriales bacterium]|nr:hypothetical protein [Flavobacteriales bacterium]
MKKYPFICGIDLDVEEILDDDKCVALSRIQTLISKLHTDFVQPSLKYQLEQYDADTTHTVFSITMAPVAYALTEKSSLGMGGFSYYDLYHSTEGKYISHFNVQAYGCYDYATFQSIVQLGYPANKVVFGMLGDEFGNASLFANAMTELQCIHHDFSTLKGAILWEYGDTHIDGVSWGQSVRRVFNCSRRSHLSRSLHTNDIIIPQCVMS